MVHYHVIVLWMLVSMLVSMF